MELKYKELCNKYEADQEEWKQFQADLLTTVRVANNFKMEAQEQLEKVIVENKALREKLIANKIDIPKEFQKTESQNVVQHCSKKDDMKEIEKNRNNDNELDKDETDMAKENIRQDIGANSKENEATKRESLKLFRSSSSPKLNSVSSKDALSIIHQIQKCQQQVAKYGENNRESKL